MFKSKLAMVILAAAALFAPMAAVNSAQAASGSDAACLLPYSYVDYQDVYLGGEIFWVTVGGGGESDLDLFVYDQFGNLLASDTGYGPVSQVWVLPYYTQWMTISVENAGGVVDCYTITVN